DSPPDARTPFMPARPPAAARPDELTYAVDDLPPFPTLALLGLQQVAVISIYLVLGVIVVRAAGAPQGVAESVVTLTMIALGWARPSRQCGRDLSAQDFLHRRLHRRSISSRRSWQHICAASPWFSG